MMLERLLGLFNLALVEAYLERKGWHSQNWYGQCWRRWVLGGEKHRFEIEYSTNDALRKNDEVWRRALHALSAYEHRPMIEIARDVVGRPLEGVAD